ncbi:mannitol dehydrogenase family protein [uncultured Jatrophihabitans sp.]|uniref:mannitol dehydrogenase family protein n=1 Tax=uncultured Jatrophihabitans sp. TaxID=1610747 RepID=UPI0035C9C85F
MNAFLRRTGAAPPVRLVHLGLGNFHRAHQAWYTDRAPDAAEWGYAAFAGRSGGTPELLAAQDGLYTLVGRAAEDDTFDVVGSIARAHAGDDHAAWLGYLASPDVAAVTLTVTEAGYLVDGEGNLDAERPEVQADLAALRKDRSAAVRTAPARLVAGLLARRAADAGPLALVPCDNLPGNGALLDRVVRELVALLDPSLADWLDASLSVVTTTVDRITPRTEPVDLETVRAATGVDDAAPVVTEPFAEWVLSGAFPAGRPAWHDVGAMFTDDVTPFEHRKLWLLNGGHSLLAYGGSVRGHATVAEAVADDTCRGWLEQWWDLARDHLPQPDHDVAVYRAALVERFANPRIRHLLAQIGADGSQKLTVRVLPVLRAERDAGRMPLAATRILAAWICTVRGFGAPVTDVRADDLLEPAAGPLADAVPRLLDVLDPRLGADDALVDAVAAQVEELTADVRR